MSQHHFGQDMDTHEIEAIVSRLPPIGEPTQTLADQDLYEVKYDTPAVKFAESGSSDDELNIADEALERVAAAAQAPRPTGTNTGFSWYSDAVADALLSETAIPQADRPFPARLKDLAHAMVESTVHTLSSMLAPVSNSARARAHQNNKEKSAPPAPTAADEEPAPAPPKKRAKKEDAPPAVQPTPPKKKRAPGKTEPQATAAEAPSLPPPPPPPGMAALDRMWQRKDGPPPFKYNDRHYWMWSHMSTNVILWALRVGNNHQEIVRMMQDHNDPLCELHVTGELARRLPARLEDAFKGYPGGDRGVRYGQAGLTTAYAFLQMFKLPKIPPLEDTCIFFAEAAHGKNDDVARTLLEYRSWCKPAGEGWKWSETVAVARAAVEKHKATLAARSKPSRAVPHAKVVVKKDRTPFDDSNDEEEEGEQDAMEVDPPEAEEAAAAPPAAELLIPALPSTELPLADEFDAHKFCSIAFAQYAPKLVSEDKDFMLRHADTLFSVREMPSKSAMIAVLRDWHKHQVNTRGREPGGSQANSAILEHSFAHFLLALCMIAEASRPTPVQASSYAFKWTELKVYGAPEGDED